MWIVPKTLSKYVPATPGLNLDLDERAWMLEQSVTWRSKFMSKQYWLKRWKKGDYVQHLCGLMPKPSLHQSFVEKYTASLPDIPVSRFQARESEKAKKTQDTYGPTSESMSGQLDLFGAFSRMSEVTPRWGYGEACPIWKKMVTERSGDCSRRRKQARLTNASDASSWPTVAASEARQGYQDRSRGKKGSQKSLTTIVVDNWSTPQARDWKGAQGRAYKGEAKDLPAQTEQNWATPNTMDHLPSGISGSFKESLTGRRKRPSNLREQVDKKTCDIYKQHAGPPAQEKSSTSGKNHGSWLTPKSRDYRDVENHILRTGENVRKTGQKFSVGLPTQAHMKEFPKAKKAQAKLNPNWVEQLMGLSTGWTDLGSWATESSPKPQK